MITQIIDGTGDGIHPVSSRFGSGIFGIAADGSRNVYVTSAYSENAFKIMPSATPTATNVPNSTPTDTPAPPTSTATQTPTNASAATDTPTPTRTPTATGPSPVCPNGCDDNNPCTADSCDPNIGCQHSITCASNLLPGGGRAKTDCMQEWLSQVPPANARRNRLVCTDGDPACDFGPSGDRACTFHIAMCFNVNASPGACAGTAVEHVTVMQPGPKPANAADALNRTAIEDALVSLGGTMQGVCRLPRAKAGRFCRQNSECDSAPGKGNGVCSRVVKFGHLSTANACTPFADITVPLRRSRGRLGSARKTIHLSTRPYARGTASDVDALTLVCLPKR